MLCKQGKSRIVIRKWCLVRDGNPFSPDFGTPPEFFGRQRYLDLVSVALTPGRRADRVLLIEGVRGSGKTALLGRFRQLGEELGWDAVYITSTNATAELSWDISHLDAWRSISSAGLTVAGFGASIAVERTPDSTRSLRQILLEHLDRSRQGLLILIDEMQKIEKDDAQSICDALNAARESGFDVALVMAGLPRTLRRLETFEKCTYMIRARHLFLSPLSVSETRQAVEAAFGESAGLLVTADLRESIVAFSSGHPYLIQLVGSELWDLAFRIGGTDGGAVTVTREMLDEAEESAYAEYAKNVLRLVFGRLGEGTIAYLNTIVATMDEHGVMRSDASIAHSLGKEDYRSIANYRVRMIEAGVLRGVAKGRVKFRIPHVPRYLAEGLPETFEDLYDEDDEFPMA